MDDLNKIDLELNDVGEKISDENVTVILLNSRPELFHDVKSTIKYGRDDLSLPEVKSVLKTKDLDHRKENKSNGENLFV